MELKDNPMRSEAGFSLAEFLVSIVLTLTVLAIALTTFNNALTVNETAALVADTNENLRTGMNFLSRDLVQTGGGIPTGGIPIPSGAGSTAVKRPSPPTQNYLFGGGTLPAVSPGDGFGPMVDGVATDMVTVIYADITLSLNTYKLTAINADGSRATVDVRTPITAADVGILAGDLILFTNALGNAIQEVTGTDGAQTMFFNQNDTLNLNQPGAAEGNLVDLQSGPNTYPDTTATRVVMATYYLNATDPTNPRLIRVLNGGAPLAIGLGVENLQLSYNLVDGVNNPVNQPTPVAPNSPNQIRQVNVFLMGRSEQLSRARLYVRNSLSTQVSLRSLSFVNRYK